MLGEISLPDSLIPAGIVKASCWKMTTLYSHTSYTFFSSYYYRKAFWKEKEVVHTAGLWREGGREGLKVGHCPNGVPIRLVYLRFVSNLKSSFSFRQISTCFSFASRFLQVLRIVTSPPDSIHR